MQIYYAKPEGLSNFGDVLNTILWPTLIPDIEKKGSGFFVGIGSLLFGDSLSTKAMIFGAGCPTEDHGADPSMWDVRFVRGPLTAEALELPAEKAITDPVILVAGMDIGAFSPRSRAFMPHWAGARDHGGEIAVACAENNVLYIDPRWDPQRILTLINSCTVLMAQSLHGAIAADALRVPWIPVKSVLPFRWYDWHLTIMQGYYPVTFREALKTRGILSSDSVHEELYGRVKEQVDILNKELEVMSEHDQVR